jgi:hypothetical protein
MKSLCLLKRFNAQTRMTISTSARVWATRTHDLGMPFSLHGSVPKKYDCSQSFGPCPIGTNLARILDVITLIAPHANPTTSSECQPVSSRKSIPEADKGEISDKIEQTRERSLPAFPHEFDLGRERRTPVDHQACECNNCV